MRMMHPTSLPLVPKMQNGLTTKQKFNQKNVNKIPQMNKRNELILNHYFLFNNQEDSMQKVP